MSRARSPSYPNTPLREAIVLIDKIFAADRRNPIDRAVAAKHLGYSGISGASDMTLAALMHYGLLERAGKGETRVTQLAVDIIHPHNEDDRRNALRRAAFSPTLFRALRERFPDGKFSSEALKSYLMREGFVESAVNPAARAYSETCLYLEKENAYGSGGNEPTNGVESTPPVDVTVYGGAQVGDLIQWESQGALQFSKPQRVRLVTDDGQWLSVENSETGIPMNEVIVEERGSVQPPPRFPLAGRKDRSSLKADPGEIEWMRTGIGLSLIHL
ncbi:conserved hypothetical protein [Methylocella tundrae]|nr:conserved hypothetical protein [Methylocella tundrae]